MNNYKIYFFKKNSAIILNTSEGMFVIPDEAGCKGELMTHGATMTNKAIHMIKSGMTFEELDSHICKYCGAFWADHYDEEQRAEHKKECEVIV